MRIMSSAPTSRQTTLLPLLTAGSGTERRQESGRACLLCPDISDFHLLSDGQRVTDFDAEIPDRTFQPRVAKQ